MTGNETADESEQRAGAGGGALSGQTSAQLSAQIRILQDEVALLRRRLAVSPSDTRPLQRQLAEAESRLVTLTERNEKLVITLREARTQLLQLKEEVDRLAQPPSGYGVFLGPGPENTAEVFTGGRRMRLTASPTIDVSALQKGQQLRLNEALTVVEGGRFELVGEVCALRELLGEDRALVVGHADEERVVHLAEPLVGTGLKPGTRCWSTPRPATPTRRCPRPRSRTSCWRRCRTSPTRTSAA